MNWRTATDTIQRCRARLHRAATGSAAMVLVLSTLACCRWASAEEHKSDGTGLPSYQDLLFLGDARPIVIRLHLVVDGRPFADVWLDYVQRLFALADRDGDGSLSREETQSPGQSDDVLADELLSILSLPGFVQADVHPADSVLSLDEFLAFVRRNRGGPFQPPPDVMSTANPQNQQLANGQFANAGRILFDTLDMDSDGRISREELRNGPESVQKLDFDGDGSSSLDELDHLRSPFGAAPNMAITAQAVSVHALSQNHDSSRLIQAVVAAYGGASSGGSESLTVSQLGFQDDQAAGFDADGSGSLDRSELRHWLSHPQPHVELVVRIGARGMDEEVVVVRSPPTLEGLTVKTAESGLVSLVSGGVHLEIGIGNSSRNEESVRQSFTIRFQQSDRDGNGYLERDEVTNNPLFEESFNRFDRDGDGMLFEEEMLGVVQGQIIASLSRIGMASANRGKDMFEILDTNRDQRVSRRELLGAVARFDLWDADSNSELADSEVPQLYQLVFDRGTPQLPGLSVTDLPVAFAVPGGSGAVRSGPAWFQKMDRNGDGDVARNEFVGTRAQFEELDTDGNELIDVTEGVTGDIAD